jgi:hypothetical protein
MAVMRAVAAAAGAPHLALYWPASLSAARRCLSTARASAATASTLDRSEWLWAWVTACKKAGLWGFRD